MTTPVPKKPERKAGMWTTISSAVDGGWGSTVRLVVIFAMITVAVVSVALVTGDSTVISTVRGFLVAP